MYAEIWPLISVVLGIVILLSLISFLKMYSFSGLIHHISIMHVVVVRNSSKGYKS